MLSADRLEARKVGLFSNQNTGNNKVNLVKQAMDYRKSGFINECAAKGINITEERAILKTAMNTYENDQKHHTVDPDHLFASLMVLR